MISAAITGRQQPKREIARQQPQFARQRHGDVHVSNYVAPCNAPVARRFAPEETFAHLHLPLSVIFIDLEVTQLRSEMLNWRHESTQM